MGLTGDEHVTEIEPQWVIDEVYNSPSAWVIASMVGVLLLGVALTVIMGVAIYRRCSRKKDEVTQGLYERIDINDKKYKDLDDYFSI